MQIEIDAQRPLEYAGNEIRRLQMDIWVKNAYIDQQREVINSLEAKVKELEGKE